MQESFDWQVSRLLAAGYPSQVIVAVAESLLQRVKHGAERVGARGLTGRPLVMPYVHTLSHGLKKVANRHEVPLVFSAPNKLQKLCPRICAQSKRGCSTRHANPFVECSVGVVYSIPMSCGKMYIGQSERCVNDRLREHALSAKKKEDKYAHLVAHISACGCEPIFRDTRILGKSKRMSSRLALEAFFIKKNDGACISEASISLHASEFEFLQGSL